MSVILKTKFLHAIYLHLSKLRTVGPISMTFDLFHLFLSWIAEYLSKDQKNTSILHNIGILRKQHYAVGKVYKLVHPCKVFWILNKIIMILLLILGSR